MYPTGALQSYWPALGAGVLLALLTAAALWGAGRGQRWLVVGWFWYLLTLLPTIGLVQVGSQVMADRFLYLPQIGVCLAVVWGTAGLAASWSRRRWPFAVVSAPALAALMVGGWQQTRHWRDSESLWIHTLACTSQNYIAHFQFGWALVEDGKVDEGIAQYRRALEIKPGFVEAQYRIGLALADRGQIDEAIAQYRRALEIRPGFADAHNNLGLTLAGRGQVDEAIDHYRKALEAKPDFVEARCNLGLALAGGGHFDEAIPQYRKALEINPDHAEAHHNLGVALASRGEFDEAIDHYRKALKIKPDYTKAHYNLGNALAGRGRPDEALAHFQKALALASAQNDRALADFIRARIAQQQSVDPAGHGP
jgi:tetratricopeptide (TPR) repeat protein